MPIFVSNIDWIKMWWVIGILTAFWSALAGITIIYPWTDPYYKIVNIILGAASGAVLFAARAGKYVENRQEPPADGIP